MAPSAAPVLPTAPVLPAATLLPAAGALPRSCRRAATPAAHPRPRTAGAVRPQAGTGRSAPPLGVGTSGRARRVRSRLTPRGRVLVLLALVLAVLGAFSLGRVASSAATSAVVQPALRQTVVHQGDTLWAVARRIAPSSDPRRVVQQLQDLNGLRGGSLRAGQQLLLPAAA